MTQFMDQLVVANAFFAWCATLEFFVKRFFFDIVPVLDIFHVNLDRQMAKLFSGTAASNAIPWLQGLLIIIINK